MESPSPHTYLIREHEIFRVYPQRLWVLFVFAFLSFNQCMFWLTFSSIASQTVTFYNVTTEATVDLLLNWGPIIFLPTLPLVYLLLNTHHGLRKCILIYAIVSLIATSYSFNTFCRYITIKFTFSSIYSFFSSCWTDSYCSYRSHWYGTCITIILSLVCSS